MRQRRAQREPWYAPRGGLRFECTACGKCCKRTGIVVFNEEDITRVSASMGMEPVAFKAKYLLWEDGDWIVEVEEGAKPCRFLDERDQCTIHEVKPVQCRTYPFWPELLDDAGAWFRERSDCEGIEQGPLISLEEIEARKLIED